MSEELLPPEGGHSFPATTWSMIERSQQADPVEANAALNRLVGRYWKPVFYYLRAHGRSFHDAQDLSQAFFSRLVERDWLRRADPERGRFRAFLLTLLKRFLSDQSPGRVRRQEAFEGDVQLIGPLMTDEERTFTPVATETPEIVFQRRWAADLLAAVLADLRRLCEAEDRADWYTLFTAARLSQEPATQQQLAAGFGLTRDGLRH